RGRPRGRRLRVPGHLILSAPATRSSRVTGSRPGRGTPGNHPGFPLSLGDVAMNHLDIIEERGDYRARLEIDTDAGQPWGDCYGDVFAVDYRHGWTVEQLHAGYQSSDDIEDALSDAL